MNLVFSYGTLVDKFPKEKIDATLTSDLRLGSYGQYPALIKDDKIHEIHGHLLELTDEEFKEADYYEGYPDLYDRVEKELSLGYEKVKAWVYFMKKEV